MLTSQTSVATLSRVLARTAAEIRRRMNSQQLIEKTLLSREHKTSLRTQAPKLLYYKCHHTGGAAGGEGLLLQDTHKQTRVRQISNTTIVPHAQISDCVWGGMSHLGLLILDGQIKFKLCREFVLRVQSVGEIHPPNATVCVDLREKHIRH